LLSLKAVFLCRGRGEREVGSPPDGRAVLPDSGRRAANWVEPWGRASVVIRKSESEDRAFPAGRIVKRR
jgi:hypothetical protein